MTVPATSVETRFALAKTVAREAEHLRFTISSSAKTLVIETKRDLQDVVSIADREVEQLIRPALCRGLPDRWRAGVRNTGWRPEPRALHGGRSDRWHEPIRQRHAQLVHIDCASEGRSPVVGVIYAPCHDELYAAADGLGATLNDRKLTLDPSRNIRNAVTGIGANNHVTPAFVAGIVERLLEAGGNFIRTAPVR